MSNTKINTKKSLTSNSTSIPVKDLKNFLDGIPDQSSIDFKVQYGDQPGQGNTLCMSAELPQ